MNNICTYTQILLLNIKVQIMALISKVFNILQTSYWNVS